MTDEQQIRELIERWVRAVQSQDIEGILDDHAADIVMYDVPKPYRGNRGIHEYRDSWPQFFDWLRTGAIFELEMLDVVAGSDVAFAYALLSYAAGNFRIAEYLQVPFYPYTGELTVICAALIGAGLGFLWFNCHPAKVIMGDTGALAIGGVIGVIAICCKQELLLAVVGGVFVLEAASVILQVLSFRLTGKRIFAMSPLHHHFELSGWKENTVIVRFWILSAIFALLGLATLKLR